ncbi:MAG TPA: F0F1 ATP synthase subunit delta [Gammaproteobacteria bacterium]|jgi:F-type H+-transporting ATPase subunit delta|nr:F0F1 ATP synthase subunit delta [Gammaproteobacteria bacterium]
MADFSTIARPYAKALFDLASAEHTLPAWSAALAAVAAVVADVHAKRVLARPSLTETQRAELVASIATALPGGELLGTREGRNLLQLLAENDRLAVLPEIAAQFDALKARAENKIKVTLVSASPVDAQLAEQVTKSLTQRLGRAVELTLEVDPSLLGGAIIRAQDMVIDGSVRTRLQRLTEALVA